MRKPWFTIACVGCSVVADGTAGSDRSADTDDTDPAFHDTDPVPVHTDTDVAHTDLPHTDAPDSDSDLPTDTDVVDTDTDLPADPLAGPRFVSGTRLTVEVWDGGGAEALARVLDTQLGVPCEVIEAEPGQLRCVPVDDGERVTRYLDDACTQPVYVSLPAACANTGHLRAPTTSRALCGSDAATSVFALATRAAPAAWWQRGAGSSCLTAPVDPAATTYTFSPLTSTPIAAGDLVAFTSEVRLGADGVGLRVLVGADGTEVAVSLAGGDGPCTPELLVGGWRCVPDRRAERARVGLHGDPTCASLPLAVKKGNAACGDPLVVVTDPGTTVPSVSDIGALWAGATYDASRGCTEFIDVGEPWEVAATSPPASTWPRLTLPLSGPGDVAARAWTSASGVALLAPVSGPFLRVASGEPCAPARTVDGTLLCLPTGARRVLAPSSFYADPACTDRVTAMGTQASARWVYVPGTACADGVDTIVATLEEAGATYAGDLYFKSGPTCSYASQTPGGSTWRHTADVDPVAALPGLVRRSVP